MKLTENTSWHQLQQHYDALRQQPHNKFGQLTILQLRQQDITLDATRHLVTPETLRLLHQLTNTCDVKTHIHNLFTGDPVNTTEQRPALHTALREMSTEHFSDNPEITLLVSQLQQQMLTISDKLRNSQWQGFNGSPITDVVNLGIGGSHLGPLLAHEALAPNHGNIRCHFVSSIDKAQLQSILQQCNPATTLFIIASKTFTTQETLQNATAARTWLQQHAGPHSIHAHFIALTAAPERAHEFGVATENTLAFWDWVGGRYSLWSAIGLPIAIHIGMPRFLELLAGAHDMDKHYYHAPYAENIPVTLALLSIWYTNFFARPAHAIIPYSYQLRSLPAYLQQLVMESIGKGVTINGEPIDYATGEIIWGGIGTDSQHAFHQLLHQGTNWCPVDFIMPTHSDYNNDTEQNILAANCQAQADALFYGRTAEQLLVAGYDQALIPHRVLPGNRPSNIIRCEKLTPRTLGALLAMYEHKVFTQSVIWQINAFDQFGVEWGKELAGQLLKKQ